MILKVATFSWLEIITLKFPRKRSCCLFSQCSLFYFSLRDKCICFMRRTTKSLPKPNLSKLYIPKERSHPCMARPPDFIGNCRPKHILLPHHQINTQNFSGNLSFQKRNTCQCQKRFIDPKWNWTSGRRDSAATNFLPLKIAWKQFCSNLNHLQKH